MVKNDVDYLILYIFYTNISQIIEQNENTINIYLLAFKLGNVMDLCLLNTGCREVCA